MADTRLLLEGSDIEALLERVRTEHGPDVRIVEADRVRSGGVAGFFAKERYAVTIEVPGAAPAAPAAVPPAPAPSRPVDAPGTLLELAAAMDAAEAAEAGVVMSTAAAVEHRFADVLAGVAATGTARTFVPAVPPPVPTPAPVGGPLPAGTPAAAAPAPALAGPALAGAAMAGRLRRLGLPGDLAERAAGLAGADLRAGLAVALSVLPTPPRVSVAAGDVLVIVGEGTVAYGVARAIAKRLRLDPAHVLLAGPSGLGTGVTPARRVSGPAEARRRSARLHRADVATVVAVDAPLDGDSGAWAREVADAFGARAVWAVVDATRKPADVIDHLATMGRVDGLVIRSTAVTRDPGSVLEVVRETGVPTVLLEGRAGTAAAWAALLLDRLGEQ